MKAGRSWPPSPRRRWRASCRRSPPRGRTGPTPSWARRLRLRDVLGRVDERQRRDRDGYAPARGLGLERGAGRLPPDRDPGVADVAFEPWGPGAGGDPSEPRLALEQRPDVVQRALVGHRIAADVDADELAIEQVPVADLLQALAADEVGALIPLDELLEPGHVQRRVLDADVRAVVEDPGLDAPGLARRDHADPVRLAGLEHLLEQVVAPRRVLQVQLVADLARPARTADDDRDAVDLGLGAEVVAQVGHVVAE